MSTISRKGKREKKVGACNALLLSFACVCGRDDAGRKKEGKKRFCGAGVRFKRKKRKKEGFLPLSLYVPLLLARQGEKNVESLLYHLTIFRPPLPNHSSRRRRAGGKKKRRAFGASPWIEFGTGGGGGKKKDLARERMQTPAGRPDAGCYTVREKKKNRHRRMPGWFLAARAQKGKGKRECTAATSPQTWSCQPFISTTREDE